MGIELTPITPNAPAPMRSSTAVHPALKMLELPPRGDSVARRWLVYGIAFYLVFGGVLFGSLVLTAPAGLRVQAIMQLIGFGDHPNVPLFLLVVMGVVLTILATSRVVLDVSQMTKEEADVEWVHRHQRDGLLLVFADADKREQLYKSGQRAIPETGVRVETLLDDRVRRVHTAAVTGSAVSTQELQSVADVRTARFGSFARYATSLLLLLAVLGTFAGVKTALPSLIDALDKAAATTGGDEAVRVSLTAPLSAVAGAFGGNALALIGAIAVGLMAQGIAFGRRNLLERLELVSSEYVYGDMATPDANPLQAAVAALRDTAVQIHGSTGMMAGIESGLQMLGSDFKTSLRGLSDRLHEIATRQEERLYDRTADSLDALQNRLADLSRLVEASALAHAGLVTQIDDRADESRRAIAHMQEANEKLAASLNAMLNLAERGQRTMDDLTSASVTLAESSEQVRAETAALRVAAEALPPAVQLLGADVGSLSTRFDQREQENRRAWDDLTDRIVTKLGERPAVSTLVPVAQQSAPPAAGRSGEEGRQMVSLLERISRTLEGNHSARPSGWAIGAWVLASTLVGGAIMYSLIRFLR